MGEAAENPISITDSEAASLPPSEGLAAVVAADGAGRLTDEQFDLTAVPPGRLHSLIRIDRRQIVSTKANEISDELSSKLMTLTRSTAEAGDPHGLQP